MSSKQELYRKEAEVLARIVENVGRGVEHLDAGLLTVQTLASRHVSKSDEMEGSIITELTHARHMLESAIIQISTLEGNVWEARSPNDAIFEQERAAWQRTHPEEEWYCKKDIEKL